MLKSIRPYVPRLIGLMAFSLVLTIQSISAQPISNNPAKDLVSRILPDLSDSFEFEIIPAKEGHDIFEFEGKNGKIVLRGNSTLSQCVAFNWYLKYHVNGHVSMNGVQLDLSHGLPIPESKTRMISRADIRYFFNYCTFAYSTPWWDWDQWEKLIDWMALQGINLPLAVTGQEAVWLAIGKRFGMTDAEIEDFLAGPPYLPFQWMGCLDSFGKVLPRNWVQKRIELQQKILSRERELGMKPVLQGFTGHVPQAILQKFPEAKAREIEWVDGFKTWMLDPMDTLFQELGGAFIEEQEKLFGSDHYYATDPFIEMLPPDTSEVYISGMGHSILRGMRNVDPKAVWVLQSWPFHYHSHFWAPNRVKALLDAVPDDGILVLDLFCDYKPLWKNSKGFYGKPWVYNFIYNFGNNTLLGAYGSLNRFYDLGKVFDDQDGRNIKGVGMMMEGFSENPLIYDIMFELAWRNEINLQDWMKKFVEFRYGTTSFITQQAWADLINARYSIGFASPGSITSYPVGAIKSVYKDTTTTALARVWKQLLSVPDNIASTDTYRFDLVNVARQCLSGISGWYLEEIKRAWKAKDAKAYEYSTEKYMELMSDMDRLLATREEFLLGKWISDARRWGETDAERDRLEWNARRIITRWGNGTSLRDYAWKEWSGMLNDFYAHRWAILFKYQQAALNHDTGFDEEACDIEIKRFEDEWSDTHKLYPSKPDGDSWEIAKALYDKYIDVSLMLK